MATTTTTHFPCGDPPVDYNDTRFTGAQSTVFNANVFSVGPNGNAILNDTYTTFTFPKEVVLTQGIETIKFELEDGSLVSLSRAELVKYICDQALREENEVVRTLWDRYNVAVKLVRSNDDGSNGS